MHTNSDGSIKISFFVIKNFPAMRAWRKNFFPPREHFFCAAEKSVFRHAIRAAESAWRKNIFPPRAARRNKVPLWILTDNQCL